MRRSAIDVYLESDVNTKLRKPAHITTVPFSLFQALCIIRQHYRKTIPSEEDNNVIVVIWAGFRSFVFTSLSKYTSIALRLITGGLYV
jgi:hypothetical protein